MAAYTATKTLLSAMLVFTFLVASVFVSGVCAQSSPAVGPSARPMKEGPTLQDQLPALGTAAVPDVEGKTDVELGGTNEPAIAVNPLNDNNIAVAVGGFGLRVSTNKGRRFSAVTLALVPATHTRCGDAALAFDSQARLFWTYLGCLSNTQGQRIGIDIFIAQVNPTTGAILAGYPVNVSAATGLPASAGHNNDKEWLAADRFSDSPFQDQLYVVWTRFDPDLGAPCRFGPQPPCQDDSSPLRTLRIGEYNGVAVANGIAYAVWTGNTATGQQILFDSARACRQREHKQKEDE